MDDHWRWADPEGQQRRVRTDELRAALSSGLIAPNAPVWRSGWNEWQPANAVPELMTSANASANGVQQNIPPPPLAMVHMQHAFERTSGAPSLPEIGEPPPPPRYDPIPAKPVPSAPQSSPTAVTAAPASAPVMVPPPPPMSSRPPDTPPIVSSTPGAMPTLSPNKSATPQMATLLGISPSQIMAASAAAHAASAPTAANAASHANANANAGPAPSSAASSGSPSKPPPPLPKRASGEMQKVSKPPPPKSAGKSGKLSKPPPPPEASGKPSKPPPPPGAGKSVRPPPPNIVAKKENVEELSGSLLLEADASGPRMPPPPNLPLSEPELIDDDEGSDDATEPQEITQQNLPSASAMMVAQNSPAPPVTSAPQTAPGFSPAPVPAPPPAPPSAFAPPSQNFALQQTAVQPPPRVAMGSTMLGGIADPMMGAPMQAPAIDAGFQPQSQLPQSQPQQPAFSPGMTMLGGVVSGGAGMQASPMITDATPPPPEMSPAAPGVAGTLLLDGNASVPIPLQNQIEQNPQYGQQQEDPFTSGPQNYGPSSERSRETFRPERPDPIPGVKLPKGMNTGVINLLALRQKNKFMLPVAGVIVGMVGILAVAGLVSAVRSCGKTGEPIASGSASAKPALSVPATTTSAIAANNTAPADSAVAPSDTVRMPAVPAPPTALPAFDSCSLEGAAITAAPRALVSTGIEVIARNPGFALGFAPSAREGIALPLGVDLAAGVESHVHSAVPIKRVVPYVGSGMLVGIADGDKPHDKLAGRRTVIGANAIDMGVGDGAVAWAPHGSDSFASLFQLGGDPFPVESLRGVPLALEKGYAVTFRRGNAIWIGIATGDNVLTPKRFSTIQGSGDKVGSPSITVSGDAVIVAWADRGGPKEPWGVRVARFSPRDAQPAVVAFSPPVGGPGVKAMSPTVAGIGQGRYMLAWSEGPVKGEHVRAANMSSDGAAIGEALDISAPDENAGQPQIAVGNDGKGVVAFLAEHGKGYEVTVRALTCKAAR